MTLLCIILKSFIQYSVESQRINFHAFIFSFLELIFWGVLFCFCFYCFIAQKCFKHRHCQLNGGKKGGQMSSDVTCAI